MQVTHGDADFFMEDIDQATRCRLGKHQLTINDQFGIICRYCSFVEIEVRDILPPLVSFCLFPTFKLLHCDVYLI